MKYDVVILTDKRYLEDSKDPYKHNVFYEDDLLNQAMQKLGLKVGRLAWDDSDFDWSTTKSILFRSTWDYFDDFTTFSIWLEKVSKLTTLFNSKDLIYWNIDKHYLQDLKRNGARIPETHFIEQHTNKTLKALHEELGWENTVLKPCVSGGARHTYKLNLENIEEHEAIFNELILEESMMLSPFQHDIVNTGERSLIMLNGICTHAVLKIAKPGDFRVQDDWGGTVHVCHPTPLEIEFAKTVVNACPEPPIYARVDIFTNNNGDLAVLEVELIEPELWFRNNPEAANILADAIKHKLA